MEEESAAGNRAEPADWRAPRGADCGEKSAFEQTREAGTLANFHTPKFPPLIL